MKNEKPDCISILKGIPGFDALEPEQLEKIALSDKVISNDPEVKALLRKCMNGKRVSPGGGGMHA